MGDQGTATKPASIDNAFAANQAEIYANQPFYGALFRVTNGQEVYLQYVEQKERLTLSKFLDQKNISQGQFLIKMDSGQGPLKEIPIMVDKNGDSSAANPFFQNMPTPQRPEQGMSSALKEQLETEIRRLNSNLQESDRKNRELTNDLLQAKRELSKDNTEKALSHEKEISSLKEEHRDEKEALKDQISELKTENRFKDLEYNQENGGPSVGNRLLNMLETNLSDDFFANILTMLQQQGGVQNATPKQLKEAARQQMQTQFDPENGAQTDPARDNPAQNGQPKADSEPQAPTQQQPQNPPQPQQITKEKMKQQFVDGLRNAAIEALTSKNANIAKYATAVRSQMALNKEHGITLDAAQWVQMAKMLANKAVKEEISPERVATVIEPVLAGVPNSYRFMLKALDSNAAATQLFNAFNIDVSPAVKSVVVEVLDVLKTKK